MKLKFWTDGSYHDDYDRDEIIDDWFQLLREHNENAPEGVNKGILSSTDTRWMHNNIPEAYIKNYTRGFMVSMIFLAIGVLLVTSDIFITFLALIAIFATAVANLAYPKFTKWRIASIESSMIYVGVITSAPFILVLASSFTHSKYSRKNDRVKEALRDRGAVIFWTYLLLTTLSGITNQTITIMFMYPAEICLVIT